MSFGERFLAGNRVHRWPSAWGNLQVPLSLPGGGWRVDGLSASQADGVVQRFGRFCTTGQPPVLPVRVRRLPVSAFRPLTEAPAEFTLDLRPRTHALDIAGITVLARLRWSPSPRGLLLTSEDEGESFAGVLENLLRVGVAYRVAEEGGALLHGASVVLDGAVIVFIGHSGAGKSTLSRLALERGLRVLSDDLTVVGWDAHRPVVDSVPFAGDLRPAAPSPGRLPLRALLHLRQGAGHHVRDLAAAEAVARLVGCAPTVNQDPYRADALVASMDRLVQRAPVGELTFRPEAGVWRALERWLEEAA